MGVGRFFCVALPFALTIGSIVFLLIGSLAGVADKGLYLLRLDVTDLSISPADAEHIVANKDNLIRSAKTDNITAIDLGLSKTYDISLWGYCSTDQEGNRHCKKPKFDWATIALNSSFVDDFGSAAGVDIELPKEITNALKVFSKVTKWTEVAFMAALIALGVEILLGIFANCSRIFSCFTYIVSGIATALVIAAASLATALTAIVVGAVESTAKFYGVRGKINTTFLGVIWIAVVFAIAASLFWLFTICCCKPEHRSSRSSSRKNRQSDGEKLLPKTGKGYAPLGNDHEMTSGYYNQNQSQSQYGAPRYPSGAARSDLAYEPYSHRA